MENKGLIFIPDISGFTRFVNEMEIDHSRHIIQELLEVVINANQIGLEISEIEGDAILFYKYGKAPELKEIYSQVEKMFCAFHKHLLAYDHRRLCQCKACAGAIELSLKVVTHYGEFTGYNVKNFSKLIGKDIIVAHQLLKNDIDKHEYWLVTTGLAGEQVPDGLPAKLNWNKSLKQTETGDISFQYAQLTHLKEELPPDPDPDLEIKNKTKLLSLSREYNTDILSLLHGVADFSTRKLWQVGIKGIDEISHETIPRLGTSHRCILEKGHRIVYSSSYLFTPDKVEYSETDEKKQTATYFTFEKIAENRIKLTLDQYIMKNPVRQIFFNLVMKKKMINRFSESLENLEKLIKNYVA
ncbi:MAG: DUF2652 domain-containing protein [Bacteroidota bacterium]